MINMFIYIKNNYISVQGAFYKYLNERSINDELAYFVLAYSSEKEQNEYANWLQNIHDFTTSKK